MLFLTFALGFLSLFSLALSAPGSYLGYSAPQIPLDRFLSLNSIANPPSTVNISLAELAELLKVNNLTQSLPNPIAKDFPKEITGTSNTSYFVVPISYEDARAAVPAEYPILTKQIKREWKDYQEDKYPLIVTVQYGHDLIAFGNVIPDFSFIAIRFPFVDLLSNGRTAFNYISAVLVSDSPLAIDGVQPYGYDTVVSTFTPPYDAYDHASNPMQIGFRSVSAKPKTRGHGQGFEANFKDVERLGQKDFNFWKGIIHQPFFGGGTSTTPLTCGLQYKIYDTILDTGRFSPIRVKGEVSLEAGVARGLPKGFHVKRAEGARFDVAFIERRYLDCNQLA